MEDIKEKTADEIKRNYNKEYYEKNKEELRRKRRNRYRKSKIELKTEYGVNIKVIDTNLYVIYGNEESSNYFLTRNDLLDILQKSINC